MRRFWPSVFALSLTIAIAGAAPIAGRAQETPKRPTQATSGPGSSEALFEGVTRIERPDPDQPATDYWLFVPSDPLPGAAAPDGPFPLVVFVPGGGLGEPEPYLAWIEHLVRRGAVVLFPEWQDTTTDDEEAAFRLNLLEDVGNALDTLDQEGVPIDSARVAVVGHSEPISAPSRLPPASCWWRRRTSTARRVQPPSSACGPGSARCRWRTGIS